MQYQSECLSALKSVANIHKPFEKAFMDTMKLFMAIPDRINFLQLGRYGCFSEQTYRNLFEHETFDWFAFNGSIISKHLTGKRKAIAIDPSYIPKSGKKTPWVGYFWSGCAGEYKRGLEIMDIGVIDIDNHECMTLGSIQTPDCKTLDNMDKNLVDWYSCYLISRKDKLQSISKFDPVQGIRGEQRKAIRIEGICKSSQKVCFLSHLVSDGREDRQVATLFLYRRFHGWT